MDRASSGNGRILFDMSEHTEDAAMMHQLSHLPWHLSLHVRADLRVGEQRREYLSIHRAERDAEGGWHVQTERDGVITFDLHGDGPLPAIVEADGALVILLPPRDQDRAYPPRATG